MGTNQNGLWTLEFGEIGSTLKALQDRGVTKVHWDRVRTDPDYARKVAEAFLSGEVESPISLELVRELMGNERFFGPDDWAALYGARFTKKQLREIARFPWNETVLNSPCPFVPGKTIRETHIAFLELDRINGTPLTIMKWQQLQPAPGQPRFYKYSSEAWYSNQRFAVRTTGKLRWRLMPLEIVPNSEDKTFADQQSMLPTNYEVPPAVTEVTKAMLYFKKSGQYVNPTRYGRCSDLTSGGYRVYVGYFDANGLVVDDWDGYRYDHIGLSAARKF
ncbi:MAG: hypothetical protein PHV78_02575 [Patescibacteria group bacterium]|nr:hypothetical protein [Patescibacteria group bacterium]